MHSCRQRVRKRCVQPGSKSRYRHISAAICSDTSDYFWSSTAQGIKQKVFISKSAKFCEVTTYRRNLRQEKREKLRNWKWGKGRGGGWGTVIPQGQSIFPRLFCRIRGQSAPGISPCTEAFSWGGTTAKQTWLVAFFLHCYVESDTVKSTFHHTYTKYEIITTLDWLCAMTSFKKRKNHFKAEAPKLFLTITH